MRIRKSVEVRLEHSRKSQSFKKEPSHARAWAISSCMARKVWEMSIAQSRMSSQATALPHTRWVLSCCSTTTFCCCCNYQNFASKFAKFDRIFSRFCKFLKFLRIFRYYLWFPAIPTQFCGNLDEKSPIRDDFSNILQKSQKITEILQIFAENL